MNLFINYWRPISIAPRDSTPILTNCGTIVWAAGRWYPCLAGGPEVRICNIGLPVNPRMWMPVPEVPVGVPDPVAGEQSAKLAEAAPRLLAAMQRVLAIDWSYGCEDGDGNMQEPSVDVAQDMVCDALNCDGLPTKGAE